jgi:TRAP-type C4-dicarboxylate transport system permease small subunit
MNVFTTDHPMTSQTSCFDTKQHPWLSFILRVLTIAIFFTPLVYGYVLYCAAADDVQGTDDSPLPESWADFILSIAVTFVFCFFCAFLIVSAYRLFMRHFQKSRLFRNADHAA